MIGLSRGFFLLFNASAIICEKWNSDARFLHLVHYMHINNSKTIQNEYENKSVSIDEFAAIKLDMP